MGETRGLIKNVETPKKYLYDCFYKGVFIMWFVVFFCVIILCFVFIKSINSERSNKITSKQTPGLRNINVKDLIEEAQSVLQEFYALVLASPANLRGELDVGFIDDIINTCKDRLESPEYKSVYAIVVKKYGSVKLQMYDWLGGMLASMYTVKTDITKKEINTLDWMLSIVNINLKHLGSKVFFSKEKPMGTSKYPKIFEC